MIIPLVAFLVILLLLAGGWSLVLWVAAIIIFGPLVLTLICHYTGITRKVFNKATDEAIMRGEISFDDAWNDKIKYGDTGYFDSYKEMAKAYGLEKKKKYFKPGNTPLMWESQPDDKHTKKNKKQLKSGGNRTIKQIDL